MKKGRLSCVIVFLMVFLVWSSRAGTPDQNLDQQATFFCQAWSRGDFERCAAFIFPPIVEQAGGLNAVVAGYKRIVRDLEKDGVTIKEQRMGIVSPITREENGLAAFVPTVTVLTVSGREFRQWGFLVALSDDDGKQWYFVDMRKGDRGTLQRLFPRLCEQTPIPLVKDEYSDFVLSEMGQKQQSSAPMPQYMVDAEKGDPATQFSVGYQYEFGLGVPVDFGEAARWYRKAAERNYIKAQVELGLLYYNGTGVPRDVNEATYWWTRAAEQGDPDAKRLLSQGGEKR